jgi:hypothetical protein
MRATSSARSPPIHSRSRSTKPLQGSQAFRHTSCAVRLQTLDRGTPIASCAVAREPGHGSDDMVKRIYPNLGEARLRAVAVEYRVDKHFERLGDRLKRLGLIGPFVIGNVTAAGAAAGTQHPAPTEVEAGEDLPESGRPDSNRRRPAWEASDPSADERPPAEINSLGALPRYPALASAASFVTGNVTADWDQFPCQFRPSTRILWSLV